MAVVQTCSSPDSRFQSAGCNCPAAGMVVCCEGSRHVWGTAGSPIQARWSRDVIRVREGRCLELSTVGDLERLRAKETVHVDGVPHDGMEYPCSSRLVRSCCLVTAGSDSIWRLETCIPTCSRGSSVTTYGKTPVVHLYASTGGGCSSGYV